MFKRDNWTCRYCGIEPHIIYLTVDHKKPRIFGGTNDMRNLLTACSECNNKKRDMSHRLFLNICQKNAI